MLLLYYDLICIFKPRNSYFWMLLAIYIYDYGILIIHNVLQLFDNINYQVNDINQINHLTIMNAFFILCCMHGVELDIILIRKNEKCTVIDDVIGCMNGIAGKTAMLYELKLIEVIARVRQLDLM